jgi:hypothetical protein
MKANQHGIAKHFSRLQGQIKKLKGTIAIFDTNTNILEITLKHPQER